PPDRAEVTVDASQRRLRSMGRKGKGCASVAPRGLQDHTLRERESSSQRIGLDKRTRSPMGFTAQQTPHDEYCPDMAHEPCIRSRLWRFPYRLTCQPPCRE